MVPASQVFVARIAPVSIKRVMTDFDKYEYFILSHPAADPVKIAEADIAAGYLRVGNVGLLPDSMQQVHIERAQLSERISKITALISSPDFLTSPESERYLIGQQLDAMLVYLKVLDKRISAYDQHVAAIESK